MSGPWTPVELDAIRRGVAGELTLAQMFELLPRRPARAIRIKYCMQGNPDEEERHNRGCLVGSFALHRAIVATGKQFT